MNTLVIVGSGLMGLMAAMELLKKGHQVDIYERDDPIGGMSAYFDFDGLRIEHYYHFICKTDFPLFKLLEDLKLSDRLHWRDTKMGDYYQGKLHKWGTPLALLGFPHLGLIDKIRYALHVMHTKGISNWTTLDKENARDWITRWIGPKAYKVMWEKAFALKFFEYQNDLSASWIGTRIKRVALSRRNLFNERAGYLEGGSAMLLERMAVEVTRLGARILLSQPIWQGRRLAHRVCTLLHAQDSPEVEMEQPAADRSSHQLFTDDPPSLQARVDPHDPLPSLRIRADHLPAGLSRHAATDENHSAEFLHKEYGVLQPRRSLDQREHRYGCEAGRGRNGTHIVSLKTC